MLNATTRDVVQWSLVLNQASNIQIDESASAIKKNENELMGKDPKTDTVKWRREWREQVARAVATMGT